ncbi:hypothetical protein CQW23_11895 [Capsicum baccatum]|uniref:Calmodulin-binding domain-containing protein n=1 Tax=Capsicum baccatum TaxID=33114 RepID=A0A2G2WR21_CAPBA|nr:hypothetical protein CQW23_11895 [Capsicum baccatum]
MATTVQLHKGKKPSPTTFRAQAQKIPESTKISVKRGSSGLSKKMDAISISNSARTSVKRASGEKLTNNSMRMIAPGNKKLRVSSLDRHGPIRGKRSSPILSPSSSLYSDGSSSRNIGNRKSSLSSTSACESANGDAIVSSSKKSGTATPNQYIKAGRAAIGSPKNLKFRKGKIIDFQSEKLGPRRLKFRPAKILENNGNESSHVRGRSSRRLIAYGKSNSAKDETMKVNLRHQSRGDKKEAPILFNNVIEETATKLEETRRSKVKALVGAFETLELTRGGNYKNREPPQSTLFSLVYNSPNNEDDLPSAIIHKPKATSKPKYFVTPTPPVRIHQTRKHTAELKIIAESSKMVRSSETKAENMIEESEVPTEIEDDPEQEESVPTHPKVRRSNQNLKKFLAMGNDAYYGSKFMLMGRVFDPKVMSNPFVQKLLDRLNFQGWAYLFRDLTTVVYVEEVIEFYINLTMIDESTIYSSVGGVEIVFDLAKLGKIL